MTDEVWADLLAEAEIVWTQPENRGRAVLSPQGGVEYVEDLVRPGRIIVWAAEEGAGKSYAVAGELGIRLACAGGTFAETWPVRVTGNVLVLSEMHQDDDFEREETVLHSLELTRAALDGRYWRLGLMTAAGGKPCLREPGWRQWCVGWCREHSVIALIVDTATGASDVEPWGKDIQAVYRDLRWMLEAAPEVAILLVVHCKKPQGGQARRITDVIGEWGRWGDVVVLQERDGPRRTKLSTFKRVRQQRRIVAVQSGGLLVEPQDLSDKRGPKVPPQEVAATVAAAPGLTYGELASRLNVSKDTATRYAKVASDAKLIVEVPNGPRGITRLYPIAAPPQTAANGLAAVQTPLVGDDHRSTARTYISAAVRAAVVACIVCGAEATPDGDLCAACDEAAELDGGRAS